MAQSNVVRIAKYAPLSEDLGAAIEGFLNCCRSKNLSGNTLIYYRNRLNAFSRYLEETCPGAGPKDVNPLIVRDFLTTETDNHSASTASHSFIALRTFFGFLVNDGFLLENPLSKVDKPRQRRAVIDTFSMQQVEAVLATCGKDYTGVRDRALVLVMMDCGLRVSELCGLRLDDLNWTEQTMLVVGKGNRERVVPFGSVTRQALLDYAARRGELDSKSLFVSVYGEALDRHRVHRIVKGRCEKAGITGLRCSPHTFRHSCAVTYLRNGGDPFSLQKLLGHSDLTMTRRYAELSQTDVQEKHRLYSPADRLQPAKNGQGRTRLR